MRRYTLCNALYAVCLSPRRLQSVPVVAPRIVTAEYRERQIGLAIAAQPRDEADPDIDVMA